MKYVDDGLCVVNHYYNQVASLLLPYETFREIMFIRLNATLVPIHLDFSYLCFHYFVIYYVHISEQYHDWYNTLGFVGSAETISDLLIL